MFRSLFIYDSTFISITFVIVRAYINVILSTVYLLKLTINKLPKPSYRLIGWNQTNGIDDSIESEADIREMDASQDTSKFMV